MKHQQGLSLIELMIAMTLGLLVLLGVSRVFVSSQQTYRTQESIGRLQENARFAMDMLSREVRHADFWGGVTPATIRKHTSLQTVGAACTESWIADIAVPIRAWRGAASSPLAGCTVSNYVPDSDVLVVRYAEPTGYVRSNFLQTAADEEGTRNGKLFLRARIGRDGYLFPWFARTDAITSIPGNEQTGVYTYRLGGRVLFLRQNAQGRPSLYTRQLDGSSTGVSQSIELIEGIEMIRFQFGLDDDGNAIVDRYVASAAMAATDWPRVLVVRVALMVRGDALDQFRDDANYTFPDGSVYSPADDVRRFPRRMFVQDIQIRNRLGRT